MKPKTVRRPNRDETQAQPPAPACGGIVRGTVILTQKGEMPIEAISVGERVITRDAGFVTVKAVHQYSVITRAISVSAGSLGHTRPDHDMELPGTQQILIRDWRAQAMFGRDQALVPASALVDGEFICDCGERPLALHLLELDGPHVIYAGGLEIASDSAAISAPLRKAA